MPRAPRPGIGTRPDPKMSGTGQGSLTREQLTTLADIWFQLQNQSMDRAYAWSVNLQHTLTPEEYDAWRKLNEQLYNADPEAAMREANKDLGVTQAEKDSGRVPTQGYLFPPPLPGYVDPQTGTRSYFDPKGNYWGVLQPNGQFPPSGQFSPSTTNPKGWSDKTGNSAAPASLPAHLQPVADAVWAQLGSPAAAPAPINRGARAE